MIAYTKNWFESGIDQGWIEQYEQEAVRFLESEYGELSQSERLCFVFTSLFQKAGHTALPLYLSPVEWAYRLDLGEISYAMLPEVPINREQLSNSSIISADDQFTPLVLEDGLISFRKNRSRERGLLKRLSLLNSENTDPVITPLQTNLLQKLFNATGTEPDWQKTAAAMSLIKSFMIISGGPGTGKTTTVARILALHQQLNHYSLKIALAAPTGKAAGRMGEALNNELNKLGLTADERAAFPSEAKTVHRLLSGTESRGLLPPVEKKRLRYDLIIVDEASMIDLNLMYRLVTHLSDHTKLILLGDKDQLASVEAGSVFADLCRKPSNAFTPESAALLKRLGVDQDLPEKNQAELDDSILYLTKSYRFGSDSGIGTLAAAIQKGEGDPSDIQAIISKFDELQHTDFNFTAEQLDSLLKEPVEMIAAAAKHSDPGDLLAYWKKTARLSVLRHGLTGSDRLNQLVEERISTMRVARVQNGWYHGRLIMVTQNDYNLGVFNGDLGVCLENEEGALWVYVESGSQLKRIHPGRLMNVNSAYFLTVHKSQGSEFDQVRLLLPRKDTPILTRELIYTAITRARTSFSLLGDLNLFEKGVFRKSERYTGLHHLIQKL